MKVSIRWKFVVAMAASFALSLPLPLRMASAVDPEPTEFKPILPVAEEGTEATSSRLRSLKPTPVPSEDSPTAPAENSPAEPTGVEAELITQRYPNGKVKLEKEMIQDADGNYVAHGAWRSYDEAGRLVVVGTYKNGLRNGIWKRQLRADESPLFATVPYKDFDAPFITAVSYENDRLQGSWTITDARGRKVHEIRFANGERDGDAVWYFTSGAIYSKSSYQNGVVTGEVVRYAPTGAVLGRENYAEGRNQAPKIEYYDGTRKKSEVTYLHAPLVVKTADDPMSATLATFESRGREERNGVFKTWHPNGQIARQGEYRYNLPVGKATWWFANGQKQMEGTYVDGKQDGHWTWWHENGIKSISGDYKDGVPAGSWVWWKDTGKVAQKADMSADNSRVSRVPTPPPDSEPVESSLELVAPQTLDR